MKTYCFNQTIVIACIYVCAGIAIGQSNKPAESTIGDLIKTGDAIIGMRVDSGNAIIPKGIIAVGIGGISEASIQITDIVNAAPAGNDGKQADWFGDIMGVLAALNVVKNTKLQLDLFKAIPAMTAILSEVDPDNPNGTLNAASDAIKNLSVTLTKSIAQHVSEQSGAVPIETTRVFVDAFKTEGFINESDWEDEAMPIDPAGVFILEPIDTVGYLKSQPWQRAAQFLRGSDSVSAFKRYAADGDGLPVLRSRYVANQALIVAKWNDLTTWVDQQRPVDP